MRIVLVSATALALVLGAGNAFAQAQPQEMSQPTTTSATTGPGNSSDPAGKLICRPVVYEGMVMAGKQDCHTQKEWDVIRYRNQQTVNSAQMRGLTSSPH
jgi:hypothetical protein